jgi:hypothetical protein
LPYLRPQQSARDFRSRSIAYPASATSCRWRQPTAPDNRPPHPPHRPAMACLPNVYGSSSARKSANRPCNHIAPAEEWRHFTSRDNLPYSPQSRLGRLSRRRKSISSSAHRWLGRQIAPRPLIPALRPAGRG